MKIHSVVNTQGGIPSVIKIFTFDFDQNPVFVVHYVPGGSRVLGVSTRRGMRGNFG